MKHLLTTTFLVLILIPATSQSKKYANLTFFNTQTAMPFGKFAGTFKESLHPYVEASIGKNLSLKEKHDWFAELKLGYFFHRFVQHGIPVTLNIGYRYKLNARFSAQTSIGGGYLHSIPATAILKAGKNGEYSNGKGIGRMQACAVYDISIGYNLKPGTEKYLRVFLGYQQRLQMPFVKSYAPLLPYNSLGFGISKSLH